MRSAKSARRAKSIFLWFIPLYIVIARVGLMNTYWGI